MIDCSECTNKNGMPAECCQEITISFDTDGDLMWWSELRWMVAHDSVNLVRAKDSGIWSVVFVTPCSKLTEDGRCSIYKQRPLICKEYSNKTCTKNGIGEIYDLEFDNLDDFDSWFSKNVVPELRQQMVDEEKELEQQLKDVWNQKSLVNRWPHK